MMPMPRASHNQKKYRCTYRCYGRWHADVLEDGYTVDVSAGQGLLRPDHKALGLELDKA